MVLRKPVASGALPDTSRSSNPSTNSNPLPYPVTPTTPHADPATEDSDGDSDEWNRSPVRAVPKEPALPSTLQAGYGRTSAELPREQHVLPSPLQIKKPDGSARSSLDARRPDLERPQTPSTPPADTSGSHPSDPHTSNNPFLHPSDSAEHQQSRNNPFIHSHRPDPAPPASAASNTLDVSLSNLSVDDTPHASSSPDQRRDSAVPEPFASIHQIPSTSQQTPPRGDDLLRERNSNDAPMSIWQSQEQAPLIPVATEDQSPQPQPAHRTRSTTTLNSTATNMTHRTTGSIGWDPGADISTFDAVTSRNHGLSNVGEVDEQPSYHRTWEEQKAWEQSERERRERDLVVASERAQRETRERLAEEEWQRGEELARAAEQGSAVAGPDSARLPDLPPRRSQEVAGNASHVPSDLPNDATRASEGLPAESQPASRRQTSETYQIKHVNWVDATTSNQPRRSPILVQNANGPCPLLALVNALVLTTPAHVNTALVETLRVREQISLGLLLDAVFDELMSGRRGDAAQGLPDVSELYAFLVTLHTGMNVNPRFITSSSMPPDRRDSFRGSEAVRQGPAPRRVEPGTFEETREMRLYGTFSVPLIHGWLPLVEQPAYAALTRAAQTYEDAQNVLFREEELEDKLRREGLTSDEQQLLQDLTTIKHFLSQSATQLSQHGLETIIASMQPGSVAILFRNDHFSTLYKHPRSGELLQLVTDLGYAGHDEVVWESLVDVTGEKGEFFAGDFRPVGNTQAVTASASANTRPVPDDDDGWTTVENRSRGRFAPGARAGQVDGSNEPGSTGPTNTVGPGSPNAEQEDHDLALALQLQEEEEDRHRRELAARRQEESLSQEFLSRSGGNSTGRRPGGSGRGQDIRPLIPPRRDQRTGGPGGTNTTDVPPPTYEHAATRPPYVPPPNHPAHPNSSPNPSQPRPAGSPANVQNMSAYGVMATQHQRQQQQQQLRQQAMGAFGSGGRFGNARAVSMRAQAPGQGMTNLPGGGPDVRRRQSAGVPTQGTSGSQGEGGDKCSVM